MNRTDNSALHVISRRSSFGRTISAFLPLMAMAILAFSSTCFAEDPTLSWDANEDAEYYQVYMRGANDTEYTQVSDKIPADTTTFKLMPSPDGRNYFFSVKAFNSCGNSSDFSDPIETPHIPYDSSVITSDITAATVTSSDSSDASGAVVYQPINLEIILPEDGAIGIEGSVLEFSANVLKGGVLSTAYMVTWTSSIDGLLGVGLDVGVTLSPGIHVVMATSTDETGQTASGSIVVYIQEVNTAPTVEITEFAGGASDATGQVFSFKANATDGQDGDLGSQIVWLSSIDGELGTGASIQPTLSPGNHTISVMVADSKGLTATASVDVTSVAYNTPPVMAILETVKGESTEQGLVVDLYGSGSDLEDGDISDRISWSSSISGALGKGGHIKTTLPAGTHVLTATITDSGGKQGSDSSSITVLPYNYPPTLTISAGTTGAITESGQTCVLSGTASDPEDGNISSSITWSSSISGKLGTGTSLSVTLVSGNHTLTGMVTDSNGKTTTTQKTISIGVYNHPPVIALGSFNAGVLDKDGQDYTFIATATDVEEGDISAYITWESNIDGYLGTGSQSMTCLSSGVHTITAQVSDSKGETASTTREIVVGVYNTSPVLTMGPHTAGDPSPSGQIFSFSATATDDEDGSLNGFITWNSSIDGYLGTGASITTALKAGVHTITATVNDVQGIVASQSIEVIVSAYNFPPTVAITGSTPGTLDATGQRYGFSASATDGEDGNVGASVTWSSSIDGSLGVGPSITTTLSSGTHTITAKAADSKGQTAYATAQIIVAVYNSPPVLSIVSATAGTLGPNGQVYTFTGSASDNESGNISSSITWTSSKDGYLGIGATIQATLTSGSHTITASVADSNGKSATAVRMISVDAYNYPPDLSITSAVSDVVGPQGQPFTFSGSASDKEDGNLASSITWTSSVSGYLGTGSSISATLKAGSQTITASVKDSLGKSSSAVRTVTAEAYNYPPEISIVSIAQNTLSSSGQSCTFRGTAIDTEDGTISSAITWKSSLSGALGTGATLTKTLCSGDHLITAKITDSKGRSVEESKSITIEVYNNKPSITAISYLKGPSTVNGQSYTFSSGASDSEDGDLSDSIVWTSSKAGSLGKGSSIQAVLASGSHVITAQVTDSKGQTSTTSKTLSVTWVNGIPTIQILDIKAGAAGADGQVHEFSGSAVDEEEGNLSSSISWTSSIDGSLGKGAEILYTLSTGTHTITAKACDSNGGCASAVRSVTVAAFNNPPVVSVLSAIGGTQDATGQYFEFTGKALDAEEGTISSRIAWTSSIDGAIGTGSTVKPHLSVGTHTITAKITDNKGKTDSTSVTVTSIKETKLELTVTFMSMSKFKLTKLTWKGGATTVTIYKNGNVIGTGPSEGTRYYWYTDSAQYKVCDSTSLKCSDTVSTGSTTTAKKKKK